MKFCIMLLNMLKRGRPKNSVSNNLEREFQKLYNRKISAETAANLLQTNRKTAYKYYKKFSNQFKLITIKNLFTAGIDRLTQQIASYDYLLLELYTSLDMINQQMNEKSNVPIPSYLQNQKISIIKEIKNICNEKTALELEIPTHESVDELVDEIIEKRGKV